MSAFGQVLELMEGEASLRSVLYVVVHLGWNGWDDWGIRELNEL